MPIDGNVLGHWTNKIRLSSFARNEAHPALGQEARVEVNDEGAVLDWTLGRDVRDRLSQPLRFIDLVQ